MSKFLEWWKDFRQQDKNGEVIGEELAELAFKAGHANAAKLYESRASIIDAEIKKAFEAGARSQALTSRVKLPSRRIEPTTQTNENVDEWRFVRTWNRVLDEITLEPMNVDALLPSSHIAWQEWMNLDGHGEQHMIEFLDWLRAHLTAKLNHSGEGK